MVVHFPIALFTVYSAMEFVRWRHLTKLPFWEGTKAVLVIVGTVSTFVALQSGEAIEQKFLGDASLWPVIRAHNTWANVTAWIYGIIAVPYFLKLIKDHGYLAALEAKLRGHYQSFMRLLNSAAMFAVSMTASLWMLPLALFGLVAVTITGALGGSIVFGPNADPFISFVYSIYGF